MTDSDHTSFHSLLCAEVRRSKTLWNAWMAVRPRALRSENAQTRAAVRKIDTNPQGTLRSIQERLRKQSFEFAPQRGVAKKRKNKTPRPIVVAPVVNRIVQRAILDTLQSENPRIKGMLGAIPEFLHSPTSVGGLPGKGSADAVRLICSAMQAGGAHFVRSDIKDFFTKVPTAKLVSWVESETGDKQFAGLLNKALVVELENAADPQVSKWLHLFPDGTVGVPQGSSLSAFCANVTLAEFDRVLNSEGLVTVRYIDDFVIIGHSEAEVKQGWEKGQRILSALQLEAWEPTPGGEKASLGETKKGFDFLSFRFSLDNVGLSRAAKQKFIDSVKATIKEGTDDIQTSLRASRRAEPRFVQTLALLDDKIRGWGDSFQHITLRLEFHQLDAQVAEHLRRFISWYSNITRSLDEKNKQRALGVALLSDTPKPISKTQGVDPTRGTPKA